MSEREIKIKKLSNGLLLTMSEGEYQEQAISAPNRNNLMLVLWDLLEKEIPKKKVIENLSDPLG